MATHDTATSYVVLWAKRHLEWLTGLGERGKPLEIIYGSPHSSAPSLRRYGVGQGDRIFIVTLKQGALAIVARARVDRVITTEEYFRDHLRLSPSLLATHLWAMSEKLAKEQPELGHRLPFGCVDEVGLFSESTPFGLDAPVPPKVLGSLRFRPKTGEERALPLVDGKLKNATPIHGHFFRLAPASARSLDAIVDGEPRRSR